MCLIWNGSSKENIQIQRQRKLILRDRCQIQLKRFPYPKTGDSLFAILDRENLKELALAWLDRGKRDYNRERHW